MKKYLNETYQIELGHAMTEFLFGEAPNLDPLDHNDPRVKYYVVDRKSSADGGKTRPYDAEWELFERFWPPVNGPQVIQIVGGAGSGKSTFIRFFFQYFLPHNENLSSTSSAVMPLANNIHTAAVRCHIILYVDMRRQDSKELRPFLFERLAKSLEHASKRLGFADSLKGSNNNTENWVQQNIFRLAKETEGNKRKWYISWVLDNSDQMRESLQYDLLQIVRAYIPEEPSSTLALPPTEDIQHHGLWRVIIPIRPETRTNLSPSWDPFHNKIAIELDPIETDILIEKRADFLVSEITTSQRHFNQESYYTTKSRADFDLRTPDEMATNLKDVMLAASKLESEEPATTFSARKVLDQLVNDSARRCLNLLPHAALSRSFRDRYELGSRKKWDVPVSAFYFFDGLIRGDANEYNAHAADCLILNLYNLGATSGRSHSIFVGLHSIYLLSQGMSWEDVWGSLVRIGYVDNDLAECERWFVRKELLKELWNGGYQIEVPVIEGHWALLKERAYTDNMAVACARSWHTADKAPQTDPLDPAELVSRFTGSIWFIKSVWNAEKDVTVYPAYASSRCGKFPDFASSFDELGFPSIARYIAVEYQTRMTKTLPRYDKSLEAIKADKEQWNKNLNELQKVIDESSAPNALKPRRM